MSDTEKTHHDSREDDAAFLRRLADGFKNTENGGSVAERLMAIAYVVEMDAKEFHENLSVVMERIAAADLSDLPEQGETIHELPE